VIHLPWFVDLRSATADGKAVQPNNGSLMLPAGTKQVDLHWTVKPNAPRMSYDDTVTVYKAEYARRYRLLMHGDASGKK
jgi:hypothetical protein